MASAAPASQDAKTAAAAGEDDYYTHRQSTMDSATMDKLLMAEKHLFHAGQATLQAWKLIGRDPDAEAANVGGGTASNPGASSVASLNAAAQAKATQPNASLSSSGTNNFGSSRYKERESDLTLHHLSTAASNTSPNAIKTHQKNNANTNTNTNANANSSANTNNNNANALSRSNAMASQSDNSSKNMSPNRLPRLAMEIPRPDGGRNSLGSGATITLGPTAGGSAALSSSNLASSSSNAAYDRSASSYSLRSTTATSAAACSSSAMEYASADGNFLAENGRSKSSHANIFGFPTRGDTPPPPRSDISLFHFTVKKVDSVLEILGSKKATIQLQVDLDARMLNFVSPHENRESYSCAAVTARPQSRLGMQLKIQTGTTSITKKINFLSTEERNNFLEALEQGKVMSKKTMMMMAPPPSSVSSSSHSQSTSTGNPSQQQQQQQQLYPTHHQQQQQQQQQQQSAAMMYRGTETSMASTVLSDDAMAFSMDASSRSKLRESIMADHFALLPGEIVLEHVQRVTHLVVMSQSDRAVQGVLKITTYRITFTPYDSSWRFGSFEVPLAAIDVITRDGLMLLLASKDLRTIRLAMHDAYTKKKGYDQLPSTPDFRWLNLLTQRMRPPNMIGALFAFQYCAEKKARSLSKPNPKDDGWLLYSPVAEYQRLGFLRGADSYNRKQSANAVDPSTVITWRLLKNSKFRFSPTYPQLMVVPSLMTEEQLVQSARFRSRARLPVVTWRHPVNKCVLARSSQPNYGMAGKRSDSDRILLKAYRDSANKNSNGDSPPLHIIDARKPIATKGNRLKGKGVENSQHYDNAVIDFMGIGNIHKMRESLEALKVLVSPNAIDDGDKRYHNRLENTRWLKHIMRVLSGARRVAEVLHEDGASVLVHCSDGWDRTPQLVCLAQLILDPHYRTLRGFAALIEKEWCSFGHKFADRVGVGKDPTDQPNERSPVMLQFLDCVWQMTRQFPTAFEFNEKLLIHVSDALISGLYGTFLYNSERERIFEKVWERTESVWSPMLENPFPFRNPTFRATNRVLYPRANLKRVVLWDAMFFRWDPESHPDYMEFMEPVETEEDDLHDHDGDGHHHHDHGHDGHGGQEYDDGNELEEVDKAALRLEIDVIHDFDEMRIRTALSDCSDMSDDDDEMEMRLSLSANHSPLLNDDGVMGKEYTDSVDHMDTLYDVDDVMMDRYRRGAEERTKQRAHCRNIRETIQMAPDQSRIKYLEQLLSESVARELQLEAELDSANHQMAIQRAVAAHAAHPSNTSNTCGTNTTANRKNTFTGQE